MEAYKRYETAAKKAGGQPIIKVGSLYIVGAGPLTEIAILAPQEGGGHVYTGFVNAAKLDLIGNANLATPHPDGQKQAGKAWGQRGRALYER